MKNVVVIGGGISGLLTAIQLVNAGIPCSVIERKRYPFHRVCGEYISNEALPFLKSLGLFPSEHRPAQIQRFQLSSTSGKNEILSLDLGGFGISRYVFDHFLYEKAKAAGVEFYLEEEAREIQFEDNAFSIGTSLRTVDAHIVIGAFGKRSKMDVYLKRKFIQQRSPYVGVKYHIRTVHPPDLIALHNFDGGYCGISNIEDGKTNLCYLTHRDNIRKFKSINEMEMAVLHQNPFLKKIFLNSTFLFDKPETINEISFETKLPVEDHVLMIGDAAGMITPLCGNGMAMAIHSSKILCDNLIRSIKLNEDRDVLERNFTTAWNAQFRNRLWYGRQVQNLFGNRVASSIAVNLAIHIPFVAHAMIKGTHGKPFV